MDVSTKDEIKKVFDGLAARRSPHNKIDRQTFLQFIPLQGQRKPKRNSNILKIKIFTKIVFVLTTVGGALFDTFDEDGNGQIDHKVIFQKNVSIFFKRNTLSRLIFRNFFVEWLYVLMANQK